MTCSQEKGTCFGATKWSRGWRGENMHKGGIKRIWGSGDSYSIVVYSIDTIVLNWIGVSIVFNWIAISILGHFIWSKIWIFPMVMIMIVLGELEYLEGLVKMVHKHKYVDKQVEVNLIE